MFVATRRSGGHDVGTARTVFGEATDDGRLLRSCGEDGRVLTTHDRKDFSGALAETIEHPGIVIYTDANYLRDEPEAAVRTLERVMDHDPEAALENEVVWLDERRLR